MAKLKCDKHQRRVFVINGKFIHRGGWGDICDSPKANIAGKTFTPQEVEKSQGLTTEKAPDG